MRAAASEKVRYAWQTADGALWAQSINKVVRFGEEGFGEAPGAREELKAGQFVLSGALSGVLPMKSGDFFTAEFLKLGRVSVRVAGESK